MLLSKAGCSTGVFEDTDNHKPPCIPKMKQHDFRELYNHLINTTNTKVLTHRFNNQFLIKIF